MKKKAKLSDEEASSKERTKEHINRKDQRAS